MLVTPEEYKTLVKGSELLDDSGAQIFDKHVRFISEGVICGDEVLFVNSLVNYTFEFSAHFKSVKDTFIRPEGLKKVEAYIEFLRSLIRPIGGISYS